MADFRDTGIEIERIINSMQSDIYRQAASRGFRASVEIRNRALDVLKGERSGRVYKINGTYGKRKSKLTKLLSKVHKHKSKGGQLYTASAPGEAPAVRTGLFRMSFKEHPYIVKSNGNLIIHARAESRLKVGKYLLGDILEGKNRPYKDKTIQLALPRVLQIFNEPYVR